MTASDERGAVAVGFFDGVHLGHQAILAGAATALTFRQHPLSVLAPESAPPLIMDCASRLAAIRACGVREVVALDFTPELAALSPEDFANRHLRAADGTAREVRCGENWNFGRGGAGDAAWLRAHGFSVTVVPYAVVDGARVSSTCIRAALAEGDVAGAAAMLGRAYAVRGTVVRGKGAGHAIGFPTLNLALDLPLARGVYAVGTPFGRAVANYGTAPTFGDRGWTKPTLEVHVIAPERAALPAEGAPLEVTFRRFLRRERMFASAEELKAQIASDAKEAERE